MDQKEMWAVEKIEHDRALKASVERRELAACGSLPGMARHAVRKAFGNLVEVEAAHATDTCSACGARFEAGQGSWGAAGGVMRWSRTGMRPETSTQAEGKAPQKGSRVRTGAAR